MRKYVVVPGYNYFLKSFIAKHDSYKMHALYKDFPLFSDSLAILIDS